jgi:DNA helicase-2/ATP-dependent DNA helicase PcrA
MQLNPHQDEVADHLGGRILTLAGPGSGKTRTLTDRTGRLIRKGVPAQSILCLTFTNKARDEMRERVEHVHGQLAQKVFISNFHGLCGTILRRLGGPLGYSERMTVCDADDQVDLLLQIARKRGMEPTKPQARALASVANDWRENLGSVEDLQAHIGGRINDSEYDVIRRYFDVLRGRNQADFSGLLSETVRLLRDVPDARERLQKRFRFIQVDEYQDTNRAQNEIVELLADHEDNVLAVGDADQSIYSWRGASPDGIPRFIERGRAKTGTCKIVKLGINYRSTAQIIEVADRLIRCSADRIPVEFSTVREGNEPPKLAALPTPDDEAEGVAESIKNLTRCDQPVPFREVAVFYRTNEMSRLVEQSLARRQIPCKVVGGGSYYDRMEVKDVVSMLRFLCNPKDGISFARIANKPTRGLGDALIGKLEAYAEKHDVDLLTAMGDAWKIVDEHGKPLGEAARKHIDDAREIFGIAPAGRSAWAIVNDVLARTRYDEWLKVRYEDKGEYESRRQNVNELTNSIADFCRKNPNSTIADYLQSISLYTDSDAKQDDNAVRLMSLHASKGLEFDVVFLIGCEHGILPHEKAVQEQGEAGMEEERRLCYVGFTRARKTLRVTWCKKRQDTFARANTGRYRAATPSRFLLESGLMALEEYQQAVRDAAGENSPRGLMTKAKPTRKGPAKRRGRA